MLACASLPVPHALAASADTSVTSSELALLRYRGSNLTNSHTNGSVQAAQSSQGKPPPAAARRRLIALIQACPSVSWVAAHPDNVSALPFDGVVIIADGDPPVPGKASNRYFPRNQSADFSFAPMSTVAMNASGLSAQLGKLKGLDLGDATDNFLLVHANAAGPFSGFATGDALVRANFKKLAAAGAAAGMRGIMFDPECYLKDSRGMPACWEPSSVCPSSCPSPCLPTPPHYEGPGCDEACLAPCRVEAQAAGEAVATAILSE